MNRNLAAHVFCLNVLGVLLLTGCPGGTVADPDAAPPRPDAGTDPCLGCDDGTSCRPGYEEAACGRGGALCTVCSSGELCVDGACEAASDCSSTCSGCCVGETCLGGDAPSACGASGFVCQACASDETCVDGACVLPCEATCAGCCTASGECVGGTSDTACGVGGASCTSCGASGASCDGGVCVDATCASTCAGCCNGDVCEGGTLASACGAAGAACVDCGSSFVCDAGAMCEADPSSRWDLIIVSATVPSTSWTGTPWDSGGGLPDVYAEASVYDSPDSYVGRTDTVADDLTPYWVDRALDGVPARGFTGLGRITIRLYDADLLLDDEMTRCTLTPTADQFDGRNISVACPSRPSSDPSGPAVAATVVVRLMPD